DLINSACLLTAMRRIIHVGIVLFLTWGQGLCAASAEDVDFRVRLVKGTHVYHMGESIEIELSYSSQIKKKYYGSVCTPAAGFDTLTPHITSPDGFSTCKNCGAVTGCLNGRPVPPRTLVRNLSPNDWT